jgi:inward rectifier potassium channel
MHPIDEASPLYGESAESLQARQAELVVLLSGMDETLSQVIYARHAYAVDDILFGRRFVDVLHRGDAGRIEVDLHRFHDTRPWPHLEAERPSS